MLEKLDCTNVSLGILKQILFLENNAFFEYLEHISTKNNTYFFKNRSVLSDIKVTRQLLQRLPKARRGYLTSVCKILVDDLAQ